MSRFFKSLKPKPAPSPPPPSPPQWAPAPEPSHKWGKWADAPEDEYEAALDFCLRHPVDPPRLLPSVAVEKIEKLGCRAWGLEYPDSPRFAGRIENVNVNVNAIGSGSGSGSGIGNEKAGKEGRGVVRVQTRAECKDVCILSDLPLVAGLYDTQGKEGVYYEVLITQMDGIIAVGTACRPYPAWRLPGWNRLSAGLHLDDMRKFFEDSDGGRDYTLSLSPSSPSSPSIPRISAGDTIGCGYAFHTGTLFYTYNGLCLPPAFTGLYLPRAAQDVFAALGVEGRCVFEVNFGGELFRWAEGNEWGWRVEGHVGRLVGVGGDGGEEELPSY